MTALRQRRPLHAGLCCAACAAVALHGLGVFMLGGAAWSGRVGSVLAAESIGAGGKAPVAQTSGSLRVRLAADPSARVVEQASVPTHDSDVSPPAIEQAESILATTYVPADQVDRPPQPDPGWIIDEAAFTHVGRGTVVLRLWVSESGRIDRVSVVQAEPPGDWVTQAIRPLPETRMRPAERGGRAVASSVVVELVADLDSPLDEAAAHARSTPSF